MKSGLYAVAFILLPLLLTACGRPPVEERSADSTLFRGISMVGMTVSDVQRSADFYRNSFDFEAGQFDADSIGGLFDGVDRQASAQRLLRTTNLRLLLVEFDEARQLVANEQWPVPVNGPGIAHLCYQIDKKHDAYGKFLEHGARHIGALEMQRLSPISPVKYAYAKDPDGIMFEVEHVNMMFIPSSVSGDVDRRIRHVSFATPDIDRLVSFYAKFLGVTKPRRANDLSSQKMDKVSGFPGSKLSMGWVQVGNLELEFVQYHSHAVELPEKPRAVEAPGYNIVVFDVSDLDAATRQFTAAGGTLLRETSMLDGKQLALGRDPDGNLVGWFSPPSNSSLSAKAFKYQPSS